MPKTIQITDRDKKEFVQMLHEDFAGINHVPCIDNVMFDFINKGIISGQFVRNYIIRKLYYRSFTTDQTFQSFEMEMSERFSISYRTVEDVIYNYSGRP